ncbi:Spy/CpxP family protein refolding chaperone [Undibacterium flavidum]|uniref:Spy/CpxP family protein refolding chaperone n=1 Tax=Undibacterium flavidum TaxID=2762297 RepID=A0ABR6YGQ8_9BURK|nr:Spy/CpxP family protein refolding chaperone [Undibacterium flavidum]MBC3875711.1 Spy/CpxP family protein refolding chaperone [Undibacterium flavidum]
MKSLKNKFFVGLAASCLLTSAGVYAQTSKSAPSATTATAAVAASTAPMEHGKNMEKMHERMQAGMEKHRAQLHDKLKLTAQQEPAWKTFTEATQPHHAAMPDRQAEHKAMMTMSTPVRMEKMLERAKDRLARMQQHLDALKTFYAVLTPEQQKIFDESHARMHGAMKMRMQHRLQERDQERLRDDRQERMRSRIPEGGLTPPPGAKKS